MATDYQGQLTLIYNKLTYIDSQMAKLALKSYVNTIQETLTASINTLTGRVNTLTQQVEEMSLTMSDLLAELRSK